VTPNPSLERTATGYAAWAFQGQQLHCPFQAQAAPPAAARSARTLGLAEPPEHIDLMFDHVVFGVSDYEASKAFFLKALEPLGVTVVSEGPLGIELCRPNEAASLCIRRERELKPSHLHLAFQAASREQVEAFYRAALAAGGKDHGAPGLRPQYHRDYYAAFVIGPDGHNIEAVCHEASP
jgi:catechol 2,3-dioxygenase-like lactoylglutathione lyase family enzyme